jgi:tRNA U34 5-methylaminomethyl-2-thiouridine-forming methyltransferase MnmC
VNLKKVTTKDGSPTLYVPELNEHYHSINGAIQESLHVFINEGLQKVIKDYLKILEIGFGTGLNAVLTQQIAEDQNINIYYEAIEKFPLEYDFISDMNFSEIPNSSFKEIHLAEWGYSVQITDFLTIKKIKTDLLTYNPIAKFDLIYFDAFAPDKQPELWTKEIFSKLYKCLISKGILTTYSSKGSVKRALREAGFTIERIPGPAGKRHMLRAIKF